MNNTQQPLILIRQDELRVLLEEQFAQLLQKLNHPASNHPETKTKDPLLSRQEAATFLKITLPTLRTWTKTGILKSFKIESRVYYCKEDLLNALKHKE